MGGLMDDLLTKKGLLDIMDFEYIAYGNADRKGDAISCQHGPGECVGNLAETCVKNITGNAPLAYVPFDACLEDGGGITRKKIAKCAAQHGLDAAAITACMDGPAGSALQIAEAKRTEAFFGDGSNQYVPFFAIDGEEFEDGEGPALLRAVCKRWKGAKPSGCPKRREVCRWE